MGIGGWYVYTMEGIGEKTCLWAFIEIDRFLVFCVFGVDCNYTLNLKTGHGSKNGEKRGYSLIRKRNKCENRENNRTFLFESRQERPHSL